MEIKGKNDFSSFEIKNLAGLKDLPGKGSIG